MTVRSATYRGPAPSAAPILLAVALVLTLSVPAAAYEQQIAGEAQTIVEQLAGSDTKTLAVVDFTDLQGNVTELGRFLAEELSIRLAGLDQGFEVVDRTHLKALLKEHKLSSTGLIDPSTARELGRIAGVDGLITGTVTPLGDSVRCAVKVLNTETAHIITSTTANIPKTQAIEALLEREISSEDSDAGKQAHAGDPSSIGSETKYGFEYRLDRCDLSGADLVCLLTVTNTQGDCRLTLWSQSRAIDKSGNQYDVAQLQLASDARAYMASADIVQGIPTIARLTFQGLGSGISKLSLLEIAGRVSEGCSSAGGSEKDFRVQFRDVPVSRK